MKHILANYPADRNSRTQAIALVAAGLLTLMLVAQLYAYEDFESVLSVVLPYSDQSLMVVTATLIVIGELFALPWLLGMKISRLFRAMSAAISIGIGGFWLVIALTNSHAANSGILGEKLAIPGGLLAFAWTLILLSCIIYVLYHDTHARTS